MKILAISDIHGDLGLVKKVAKLIDQEKIDLVILAGDQTWFETSTKNLVGPLTKKRTLIIPSNHESEETLKSWEKIYPNLKSIHKKSHEEDGVGFFGSGTLEWGITNKKSPVYEELKKAHEKIKHLKKKIMVTHEPPAGSKIELLGFPGTYGITKAIEKFSPDILICGHIHEGGGLIEKINKTRVINVARTPTIFEI
ncbi:MAG: metallophosphoesterase [Nanoarchaeota archaeon]|nr:metallophosphoesterase [Nanoarchaeota archaeon]